MAAASHMYQYICHDCGIETYAMSEIPNRWDLASIDMMSRGWLQLPEGGWICVECRQKRRHLQSMVEIEEHFKDTSSEFVRVAGEIIDDLENIVWGNT